MKKNDYEEDSADVKRYHLFLSQLFDKQKRVAVFVKHMYSFSTRDMGYMIS